MRRLGALCVCALVMGACAADSDVTQCQLEPSASTSTLANQTLRDETVGLTVELTFHGATHTELANMLSALRRFQEADLVLPSLDIYFGDDCRQRFGSVGRFVMTSPEPPWRIDVCTCASYFHELAHAWDRWNLTDRDRLRIMDLLGFDSWNGPQVPWAQRGEEALAELLARVLKQVVINHPTPQQLEDWDDFQAVTGSSPPVIRSIRVGTGPRP